jgi:hypothetical protein
VVQNENSNNHDHNPFFEFFGFDVIVDANLRPWLLEVNSPPQLHIDGDIDKMVKPHLASDMIKKVFHKEMLTKENPHSDLDDDIP